MLRAELTPQSTPHYLESEILLIINNLRTRLVLVDCNSRARQEGRKCQKLPAFVLQTPETISGDQSILAGAADCPLISLTVLQHAGQCWASLMFPRDQH